MSVEVMKQDSDCQRCDGKGCVACDARMQEPVAWMYKGEPWFDGSKWHEQYSVTTDEQVARFKGNNCQPLYTAPPQRQPLTGEEILDLWKQVYEPGHQLHVLANALARAVERKHGIGEVK